MPLKCSGVLIDCGPLSALSLMLLYSLHDGLAAPYPTWPLEAKRSRTRKKLEPVCKACCKIGFDCETKESRTRSFDATDSVSFSAVGKELRTECETLRESNWMRPALPIVDDHIQHVKLINVVWHEEMRHCVFSILSLSWAQWSTESCLCPLWGLV